MLLSYVSQYRSIFLFYILFSLSSVVVVYIEPSTTVLGGSEVFVGMGSTINLTCVIRLSPEPPNSIRWQHNNQVNINLVYYEEETLSLRFLFLCLSFLSFIFFFSIFFFIPLAIVFVLSTSISLISIYFYLKNLTPYYSPFCSQPTLFRLYKEYLNQHGGPFFFGKKTSFLCLRKSRRGLKKKHHGVLGAYCTKVFLCI